MYATAADVWTVGGRGWVGRGEVVAVMSDGLMHTGREGGRQEKEEEGGRHDLFIKFTNKKLMFVC